MAKYSTSGLGLQIHLTLRPIESFKMHFVFFKTYFLFIAFHGFSKVGLEAHVRVWLNAPEFRLQTGPGAIYQSEIFSKLFPITQKLTTAFQVLKSHISCDYGRCINQRGSYMCLCESGFAFDSSNTTCLPVDLCLTGDHGESLKKKLKGENTENPPRVPR